MAGWLASQVQSLLAATDSFFAWLVGAAEGGSTYALSRWVFLRALGVIYLIAFVSLWVQVKGLIGPDGILPANELLRALRLNLGPERYRVVPTVFWLGAGDRALALVCALGVLCATLLVADVWPVANLVCLWVLYLSLTAVGRDFLEFQWDVLLLEAGFLAILFAPAHVVPGHGAARPASAFALFLLWWLLFRLTFQSGIVKLTSGDPTWRNLTALDYHFFTQPLPTWPAWYAYQLPQWSKKLSVLLTFVFEIGFPLMIFGTKGMRMAACAGILFLQLLIFATGNYNFFNLLTIALALLLLDDGFWARAFPAPLVRFLAASGGSGAPPAVGALLRTAIGLFVLLVSLIKFWLSLFPDSALRMPNVLTRPVAWASPFRSINNYGLFRVMTIERPEIIVEGSADGATWLAYEFKYKPGDLSRRPAFVEPHQPRLDWQMWFAALSSYHVTPWFQAFLARLLQGSPDVLALLRHNPFPGHPPKYIRARLFDYRFTSFEERRSTGNWWRREPEGAYSPELTLAPRDIRRP